MNGDQLSIDAMLAAMRRIGAAPAHYVDGYEAGFQGWEMVACTDVFRRGYRAGREARERGAHKEDA